VYKTHTLKITRLAIWPPSHTHISPRSSRPRSISSLPNNNLLLFHQQLLTQAEFYQATWDVVNSPSTSVTKWGPIEDFDTSGATTLEFAFTTARNEAGEPNGQNTKAATFNGDISKWITSSVTSLRNTFSSAAAFNGDMSKWDTSEVTNMRYTFYKAASFTGTGIDLWNINKVTQDMTFTFSGAKALTSRRSSRCNKRKIADAWKSNAAFALFATRSPDTFWATDDSTALRYHIDRDTLCSVR
jgi:surface protein